ncbi:hypothetical protein GGR26_001705 [Lewinella marina]|nr:hypothetical protein [Neolewinella marina]
MPTWDDLAIPGQEIEIPSLHRAIVVKEKGTQVQQNLDSTSGITTIRNEFTSP